jgi:hypothetical protein
MKKAKRNCQQNGIRGKKNRVSAREVDEFLMFLEMDER